MIELLSPAGSLEKLKAAISYGADAVYLGGSKLNLRAFADNFSEEELKEAILYAHERGKKVYVTLNVFPHNEDIEGLSDYLMSLYNMEVDAIIVSDPGIIMLAREVAPELEIHLSTQSNNVNYLSCLFWHKMGVKRIVLARELSLKEIKEIREKLPETCELEAFVHGSMCVSYSGRCLISNYMTGRDSNRGECAQPCRYKYSLMEEKRPGQYFPVFEDEKGTYIMNSKDLCMIEYIKELSEAGIMSFKIEGRMKSAFYVASVTKAYREAIDQYTTAGESSKFDPSLYQYLDMVSHRKYCTGFYFGDINREVYETSSYVRDYDIVALVLDYDADAGVLTLAQRNKAFKDDSVVVLRQKGGIFSLKLTNMRNREGALIDSTPQAEMIYKVDVKLSKGETLSKDDMLIKFKGDK